MTPSSDLIGKKIEIGNISNFGNPPSEKNISLKHLKLSKNHFKTKSFFVQLTHSNSKFIFEKNMKIQTPPLQIFNFGLFDFWR